MHDADWWISFHEDYPGLNGLMHAYFANANCGITCIRLKLISSHDADGCLIDHEARIADIIIPDEFKLELAIHHWMDHKINA